MEQVGRYQVYKEAAEGDQGERNSGNGRRILPTLDRLVDYTDRKQDKSYSVYERSKNFEPVVSVGFFGSRRSNRKPDREQRQRECSDIREHVARIGHQRQRIRKPAANGFGDHVRKCEYKRDL